MKTSSSTAEVSPLKLRSILLATLLGVAVGTVSALIRPQSLPSTGTGLDNQPLPPARTAAEKPAAGTFMSTEGSGPVKPGNLQFVEKKIRGQIDRMNREDLGNGELYQGLLRTPDAPSLREHGIDEAKFKQLQKIGNEASRQCFKAMHDRMQRDPARSDPEHGIIAWIIPGDPVAAAAMRTELRDQLATVAGQEFADEIVSEASLQSMFGYFGATDVPITVVLPTDDTTDNGRPSFSKEQGRDLGRVTFTYRNPETNRVDNGALMDATPEGISNFYGDFFVDLLNP